MEARPVRRALGLSSPAHPPSGRRDKGMAMLSRALLFLAFVGVAAAAPNITTTSLPNGQVGTSYDRTIAVSGAQGSVDWSITSGALPAGLTMNANTGRITGTPTAPG